MAITDYKGLEYIQSDGNQGCMTDIIPSYYTPIVFDMALVEPTESNRYIYLAIVSSTNTLGSTDCYMAVLPNKTTQEAVFMYGTGTWYGGSASISTSRVTVRFGGLGRYSSWASSSFSIPSTTLTAPHSYMGVLGCPIYHGDTGTYTFSPWGRTRCRMYGAKIYDDTDTSLLKHNLIPVERISDGEIGLYDTIDDKFYGNAGTGTFTKGSEVGLWYYDEDGELTNSFFMDIQESAMSQPYPHALWRITEGVNGGLPYNGLLTEAPYFGAFANATDLTVVRIPQSVKKIGRESFRGTQLQSVTIARDCEYYPTSFPDGCEVHFYPD